MRKKIERAQCIGMQGTHNEALYHYIKVLTDIVNELVEAHNKQIEEERLRYVFGEDKRDDEDKKGVDKREDQAEKMIKDIEKNYGVDTGIQSGKELHKFLKEKGFESLSQLIKPTQGTPEECKMVVIDTEKGSELHGICDECKKKMKFTVDIGEERSLNKEELDKIRASLIHTNIRLNESQGVNDKELQKVDRLLSLGK